MLIRVESLILRLVKGLSPLKPTLVVSGNSLVLRRKVWLLRGFAEVPQKDGNFKVTYKARRRERYHLRNDRLCRVE